ncbi:amylo-alpha-1,6-glucosidase [Sinorhizobium saheli]|jgi:glycogen debranching enzyme|uniref:Amylo-alpha-1,6-glucosidase n=1 Tax=Sinorhizobium saheli TaxID=36856 RepID=A0A178Y5B4_SINSA|nr:amylo-alpha-1,6-glucosidase [Sinorhizobium saheli]MQW88773.1 amylo-alpha-1,6-glucosidase [Sinorhizobium saheli]OAP42213.1 amylo-alpha-1,6-glucosidase [Sinorhizobium saheli]
MGADIYGGPAEAGPDETNTGILAPAAVSRYERSSRSLKHGDTFAVFDHLCDALASSGNPEGIFHRDTRHLSQFVLTLNGARPLLLSSTLRDDNATLECDLTNPTLVLDDAGGEVLKHDLIHVRRTRFLWNEACYERLVLRNYDEVPRTLKVEVQFAADFADLFEVRGTARPRRGRHHGARVAKDRVLLAYDGLDGRTRSTALRFEPVPQTLSGAKASFVVALAPHQAQSIFIEIVCHDRRENRNPASFNFFLALRDARRALRYSSTRAARIVTSNAVFNEAVRRSVADLYVLLTETPEGPYPYAGIPWFSTAFGRDALITALETLWLDPEIAKGVLGHLAANQATDFDPSADAEPGKILHEMRYGEMAELGEVPFRRYYGSIDSTPLFVMLAGAYLDRTGDLQTVRSLWPNLLAALDWIDRFGDRDADGFVEYGSRTAKGLVNQGWKDSHDSIFHADGRLAEGPIALAEVQAYVFGAWQAAAGLSRKLGHADDALKFEQRAADLRARFDKAFFDDDLATYVLALDGDKKPCRVHSSNAGHALFTGIALPERAGKVVLALMAQSSFCGWGVRTIAASEARYNPMSYHNGSVWPHDNALIASGFVRYGFRAEASSIFEGLFSASTYIDLRRLPELFCGFARQRARGPTFYPVSCVPQAWAAAAPLYLLQSMIGLGFDPDKGHVTLSEPTLPPFLDEVVLKHLRIGSGEVDIALRRSRSQVVVDVLERKGRVKVTTTH